MFTTEDLVRVAKDNFKMVAVAGLKSAAVSAFPILASPVPMYFIDAFLNWLVSKIADIMEEKAFFIYTDFRVSKQGREYVSAKVDGYKAEVSGNIEAIKEAHEKIKETFRVFAPFNM